jgi:hypothetical protein
MSAAIKSLTLSPRQAAAFLGIGKTKLIALVHAGRIKASQTYFEISGMAYLS